MRWFLILSLFAMTNSSAALLDKESVSFAFQPPQDNVPNETLTLPSSSDLPALLSLLHLRATTEQPGGNKKLKKIYLCETCHSSALNRHNRYLPLLRGQNLDYLFAKIYSFKSDKRSKHPFPPYLQALSDQDVMDISLFYASQKSDLNKTWVVAAMTESAQSDAGKTASLDSCHTCHGVDGKGDNLIPVISGQNENYLSYRIREIASQSSRIHVKSVAAVDCSIANTGIRESRQIASQLALVLDDSSVKRGETIYRQNCASCHEQGERGAPKLSDKASWHDRVRQGTEELVNSTILGKAKMPYRGGNWFLSRNQLTDAIHFMIKRVVATE